MNYNSLLKNQNYVLLQGANLINRLGDSIDAIALSWLVYEVSDSAAVAAINYCLNYLPTVILQPLMGAFVADKSKQKIMIIADSARAIIITVLAFCVLFGTVNTYMVIIATFLMSCFETLRLPSASAIVPLLIKPEDYKNASSLSSSISRVAELVGQGIGGVIVGFFGMSFAIFIDAMSFVLSALLLSFMSVRETFSKSTKNSSVLSNLKEGLSYVRENPILIYICIIACLANMLLVPFNALQSAFVSTYYQGNATYLSYMGVALSLGSLLGAIVFPSLSKRLSNKILILIIFPTCAFFYFGLLFAGMIPLKILSIIIIIITNFITGILVASSNALISVILMLKTKQCYLSRVGALLNATSQSLVPFTSLIISLLANTMSCDKLFLLSAIIIVVLSISFFLSKRSEVLNA